MKSVKLTCDCGCGVTTSLPKQCGWFVLSQCEHKGSRTIPTLDYEFHFSTLECLEKWTKKAVPIVASMQKGPHCEPRGSYISPDLPGIHA